MLSADGRTEGGRFGRPRTGRTGGRCSLIFNDFGGVWDQKVKQPGAACAGLCRPVPACAGLWPASPAPIKELVEDGWLDGWLAGWLAGWAGWLARWAGWEDF